MTEFVGLDMEMTFKDDYHDVLDTIERVFLHIFEGLNARCKLEIEAVRKQYPFADLKFQRPALRMTFKEATALLREHGPAIGAEQVAALEAQKAKAVRHRVPSNPPASARELPCRPPLIRSARRARPARRRRRATRRRSRR